MKASRLIKKIPQAAGRAPGGSMVRNGPCFKGDAVQLGFIFKHAGFEGPFEAVFKGPEAPENGPPKGHQTSVRSPFGAP